MANETIKGDYYPSDEPEVRTWLPGQGRTRTIYRLLWIIGVLQAAFAWVGNFLIMVGSYGAFRRLAALETIVSHLAIGLICIGVAEGLRLIATRSE